MIFQRYKFTNLLTEDQLDTAAYPSINEVIKDDIMKVATWLLLEIISGMQLLTWNATLGKVDLNKFGKSQKMLFRKSHVAKLMRPLTNFIYWEVYHGSIIEKDWQLLSNFPLCYLYLFSLLHLFRCLMIC